MEGSFFDSRASLWAVRSEEETQSFPMFSLAVDIASIASTVFNNSSSRPFNFTASPVINTKRPSSKNHFDSRWKRELRRSWTRRSVANDDLISFRSFRSSRPTSQTRLVSLFREHIFFLIQHSPIYFSRNVRKALYTGYRVDVRNESLFLSALELQHQQTYREEHDNPDDGGDVAVVDVRLRDAPATGQHGAQSGRCHRQR